MKKMLNLAFLTSFGLLFLLVCSNPADAKYSARIRLCFPNIAQTIEESVNILKQKTVLSGKITMLIPDKFEIMNSVMLNAKYPQKGHQPSEVYTNKEGTINIALNHTQNKANDDNLPEIKKAIEAQFNRSAVNFIKSEIVDVNNKKIIVMEFISTAVDTKIYNLMTVTIIEKRLGMITFNCTESNMKLWEPIGKKIINSIIYNN